MKNGVLVQPVCNVLVFLFFLIDKQEFVIWNPFCSTATVNEASWWKSILSSQGADLMASPGFVREEKRPDGGGSWEIPVSSLYPQSHSAGLPRWARGPGWAFDVDLTLQTVWWASPGVTMLRERESWCTVTQLWARAWHYYRDGGAPK